MKPITLALGALAVTLGLAGCGTMTSLSADVSSYGQWPASRAPGRYVFERLPSQEAQANFQARVEDAARPALAAKGFVPASRVEDADVLVQVAAQARSVPSPYADPWYRPDGRFFGGFGWGVGRGGGIGIGMSFDPPLTQMQVDVLVRDRRSSQTLYETHAVHQRAGGLIESLMPTLFDAALKDFPAQAVSPRVVTVPVVPPAAAASKP